MKTLMILCVALLSISVICGQAIAVDFASIGYSEDTIIEDADTRQCYGTVIYNHDYSFENGYCWQGQGTTPPYYGAFAESFDVGDGIYIDCVLLWLTQVGGYHGQQLDIYVWDDGVTGPPAAVQCVWPAQAGLEIGYWPTCTLNELRMSCCIWEEFSVGYWADFSTENCGWYCCADENGFGGFPWTCVAPGTGYPTGWQNPTAIWGGCQSMGIGAVIQGFSSPPECQTWGSIKAMFE